MHSLPKLGFLTILHDPPSFLGGYLVTNGWGRPLEFRLSSPVQPTRVQQILYGPTLKPYVCGELIGKTLVEKSGVAADWILTDCEAALELRRYVSVPVTWFGGTGGSPVPLAPESGLAASTGGSPVPHYNTRCHPQFEQDSAVVQVLLAQLDPAIDLAEPFGRIREALAEARKMGAASRAA